MSRLTRAGKDRYQLIELCALSSAVLADTDRVCDPADDNDRLLLGSQGTMSEAELHLIKQRMWIGRLNKARRGELTFPLPGGYVRHPSGEVAFDPDEQVQTITHLVFTQFERIGTLHDLLRFLVDHGIQLGIRLREGLDKGTLEWRRPNRMTLQTLLHNPACAGICAYGRRRVDPRRKDPARQPPKLSGRWPHSRCRWCSSRPRSRRPAAFIARYRIRTLPDRQPSRRGTPGSPSDEATSGRNMKATPRVPGCTAHTKGSPGSRGERRET
ncbi:recombinase family protein [Streptomyces spectabilis]|uniref:recombinase family protein n=1 Tax=Streptomyces spectabilis TaxID=68270 RepID=UPI0021F3BC57|nr:recombinase family protein [Streptomyces spectabilis]